MFYSITLNMPCRRKTRHHDRVRANKLRNRDEGFVLPYVLAVVAILAIAGAIAMERLQRSTDMISSVQAQMRAESIMSSVEAQVIYSLLSGNSLSGGYDLNPESPIQMEFGIMSADGRQMLRPGDVEQIEKNFWKAVGESRIAQTRQGIAIVTIQDISGLVSINKPGSSYMNSILGHAGLSRSDMRRPVRRLQDYTDMDHIRRPQGAEHSDYRLKKMMAPTNSPLRSYGELANVMGWDEALVKLDKSVLFDMMTLNIKTEFRRSFTHPKHAGVIGIEKESLLFSKSPDMIDTINQYNTFPSGETRLTIWVPRDGFVGPDAIYDKRVVEISHNTGGVGRPYRRRWVYETTVLGDDLDFDMTRIDELKNVIHAPLVRP